MCVCVCVVCGVCVCGVLVWCVACKCGVWCGVWHACMVCVCVWFVNVKGMASYTIYRPSICIYVPLSLLYLSPLTLLPLSFSSLPPLSPFIPLCVLPYSFSLVNSSVIDLTADTSDDEYPIDFR